MLNEKLEYELYLEGNVTAELLRYDALADSLSGIRRPLTILTRGMIDLCREEGISFPETERCGKLLMRLWLGSQETIDAPEVLQRPLRMAKENNLHRYLDNLLSIRGGKKPKPESVEKIHGKIRAKLADLSDSVFTSSEKSQNHANDYNRITEDSIFADALLAGPLQERYLAFRCKEQDEPGDISFRHIRAQNNVDIALAMIGFYLQHKAQDQEYIPVTYVEIANWVGCPCKKKTSKKEEENPKKNTKPGKAERNIKDVRDNTQYFCYGGQPLFEEYQFDNTNKLRVNPRWILDHEAKLITPEQVEDHRDFCIFCDAVSLKQSEKGITPLPRFR